MAMGHRKSPSLQTAQVGMFSTSSSLDSGESCVENNVGDQTKALLLNEEVLKEACKQRIGINVVKGIEEERWRSRNEAKRVWLASLGLWKVVLSFFATTNYLYM